ncbi:MAG: hypothetical protein ABWK15_07550 [Dissulfuribacterales bacterium]
MTLKFYGILSKLFGLLAGQSILLFFLFCTTDSALAANIDLTITQTSTQNQVHVTVLNRSSIPVQIQGITVILAFKEYRADVVTIPAQVSHTKTFDVTPPPSTGTYPLIIKVTYLNDGQRLSLNHVGRFINGEDTGESFTSGTLQNLNINQDGALILRSNQPHLWRLILPDGITILEDRVLKEARLWRIRSTITGLYNSYSIFAIAEADMNGKHYTSISGARLMVMGNSMAQRGNTPSFILLVIFFLALTAFVVTNARHQNRFTDASAKYAARIFWLSTAYWLLKDAPILLSWLMQKLTALMETPWPTILSQPLIDHLTGKNYSHFFTYFIDAYYWLAIALLFPYLYYTDHHLSARNDKYVNLLQSITDIFILKKSWNTHAKLGFLTICVKLFFAPMLVSWSINNILHINNLIHNQTVWNLRSINSFIVDCLILLDTTIFAFGYTIESRYLKNVIKSVEPTLLGWVVCLWCYPPFNAFSFRPFDISLWNIAIQNRPEWLESLVICLITGLWGIFVWGSVALGFKGSNLTNRGIISHGPYRFCRHPAYTAKVLVWWLEGIFFARYGLSLLISFTIIYGLRAWTEERHLSQDSDYFAYKRQVKWWCVPGVF